MHNVLIDVGNNQTAGEMRNLAFDGICTLGFTYF